MCIPGTAEVVRSRAAEHGPPAVSRRAVLAAGAGAAVAAAWRPRPAAASRVPVKRVQDLTHVFREGFPVYVGSSPERTTLTTIPANGFYSQGWTFGEHSGTHLDAPGHFIAGGRLVPQIDAGELIVPVVVIDVSARAADDPDTAVTRADLVDFERGNGRIPRGAAVLMHSGWESRVGDEDAYRNAGPDGLYHFPGFDGGAVEWLIERRDVACIGVDTLSLDPGNSTTFDAHYTLLGANRYGLENVANLARIPARGATMFVGLVPWEEGSGGPCRLIARW